jgi:hypothetical protein
VKGVELMLENVSAKYDKAFEDSVDAISEIIHSFPYDVSREYEARRRHRKAMYEMGEELRRLEKEEPKRYSEIMKRQAEIARFEEEYL